MALSTATITFDISDQLGNDFDPRRTKVWVTTNTDTIIDGSGDKIRLGSGNVTLNSDGTGSIVVWVPGTGSNPASWQTTVHVDYPDRNAPSGRRTQSFGPFTVTANANLADLVAEMPVQPEYASEVLDRLDALEAGGVGGGTSGALIVVSGGTIDLPNSEDNGWLVGYKVTATTTIEGMTFAAGTYIFERDTTVTSGWTYRTIDDGTEVTTGPVDSTPPVAGTLASSSITATGATVTASGASDTTALHASPYSFSKDNGSTWTAYQSSAVYAWTGLTASTAYQMRHRVKDAAGNVTTGTAITVTTSAASLPFDTTNLKGRWDASTLSGTAGTDISTWTDAAGVADMAQATPGKRPNVQPATLNGLAVARFASDDYMDSAPRATSNQTLVILRKITDASTTTVHMWNGSASTAINYGSGPIVLSGNKAVFVHGSGIPSDGAATAGVWERWIIRTGPSLATLHVNGTQVITDTTAMTAVASGGVARLGASFTDPGTSLPQYNSGGMDLAEAMIFDAILDPTQVAAVDAYLVDKWGL